MARGLILVAAVLMAVLPGRALAQASPEHVLALQSAVSAVAGALPVRPSLFPSVVVSEDFALRVEGNDVVATTRFLREASRDAIGAAVAHGLLDDPVELAVTLDRAGLDGPAGLAQIHHRLASLVALEVRHRAAATAAYQEMVTVTAEQSFNAASREGYHVIYRSMIDAAGARYQQAAAAYQAIVAEMYRHASLPTLTAATVADVTEITAVLRGTLPPEASLWTPRIRAVVDAARPPSP